MSGKRFKGIKFLGKKPNEIFIKDKEKDYYIRTEDEVVELLNELSDENNILNKNEDDLKECTIENIKLKEENEQLKKRNKFLEEFDGQAKTVANLKAENEQLQQELRGMDKLLKSYRETIKHDAELLADATRNGYLPPLDDFVKG